MAVKKRVRKPPLTFTIPPHVSASGDQSRPSPSSTTLGKSKSSRHTQAIISTYHTLLKRRKQLSAAKHIDNHAISQVDAELEKLGGLDAYQKASQMGQTKERGGVSGRVLVPWLEELGWGLGATVHARDGMDSVRGRKKDKGKGRASVEEVEVQEREMRCCSMLEIGAVRPDNYAPYRWIHNTPIDINSQHPSILQQDFFQRPLPSAHLDPSETPSSSNSSERERFDIISCSLVINFVDDPHLRGRMLRLIHLFLHPRPSSLLFLVLPLPCVNNSRYLDRDKMIKMMQAVGFEMVNERWKEGNKVGYWLFAWRAPMDEDKVDESLRRKILVRHGGGYNNFAVCLPPPIDVDSHPSM